MNQQTKERAEKLLEHVTDEMDITFGATTYPWRMRVSPSNYQALKTYDAKGRPSWRGELFYEKDGHEYLRAIHNENTPFKLHYRVVIDPTLKRKPLYQTKVELDDEVEPDVRARYEAEWRGAPDGLPVPETSPELTADELVRAIVELAVLGASCSVRKERTFSKSYPYCTLVFPGGGYVGFPAFDEQAIDRTATGKILGWLLTTMEAKGYLVNLEHAPARVTATVFRLDPDAAGGLAELGAHTQSYRSRFTAHQSRLKAVLTAVTHTLRAAPPGG